MTDILGLLAAATAPDRVLPGDANDDYSHDESLAGQPQRPLAVVIPTTTAEVSAILRIANEHLIPVTARGSGAGVSGAVIPRPDSIVVSFEQMRRVQIDEENLVAVVQPGVTLLEIDEITARHALFYPVLPGEHSVVRSGGKFVKISTGSDLTQLVIGSEGTLALVTEATIRLFPRPRHQATILAPFRTLADLMQAVPQIVATGINVTTLEYIDAETLRGLASEFDLRLGVPDGVKAQAYLAVILEGNHAQRLEDEVAEHIAGLDAVEVYVLPPNAGHELIEAREKAYWLAKRAGIHDIVDVVVPRASICDFMATVAQIATARSAYISGGGHAGDGNIHLSIYKEDPAERTAAMRELYQAGMALGGAISGEHGIGTLKKEHFLALENPDKLDLLRRIKMAFDPNAILNPSVVFDQPALIS